MSSPTEATKTTTVTLHVDTDEPRLTVVQVPQPGQAGEVICELEITGGSAAEARAFVAFLDQSDLNPDEGTLADSFQDLVFPLQDSGGNRLTPRFNTQTAHGSVRMVAMAFSEGEHINRPLEAVVIVDW
jgi:hypothetical protein